MVNIKVFQGNSIDDAMNGTSVVDGASIALKHHLYVPTWTLQSRLAEIRHYPDRKKISIAFKNGIPVAVALLDEKDRLIQVFCKPEHRMKGYGSKCVQAIKPEKRVHAYAGAQGTWLFWEKQGISTKW